MATVADTMRENLSAALEQVNIIPAAPAAPSVPQAFANARVKPIDSLKPFELSLTNNPVELRQWVRKFKYFYSQSNLGLATIVDQQAYVRQCIDADLDTSISVCLSDNTDIWSDDVMIALIEEVYLQKYPMFSRRLDYFWLTRQTGMTPSA